MVHRDIKPESILVHERHALVPDFDIGKASMAPSDHAGMHTQLGMTAGTPAYMSPKRAVGEYGSARA